jgi:hypothetical protein
MVPTFNHIVTHMELVTQQPELSTNFPTLKGIGHVHMCKVSEVKTSCGQSPPGLYTHSQRPTKNSGGISRLYSQHSLVCRQHTSAHIAVSIYVINMAITQHNTPNKWPTMMIRSNFTQLSLIFK